MKFLMVLSLLISNSIAVAGVKKMVVMKTNHGEIKIELFADKAPKTVENFLSYVEIGRASCRERVSTSV